MALAFRNGRETFREPEGSTFTLVMTGDCCPWKSALAGIRGGQADAMVAAVKPFIAAADVKLMQWETPLAGTESPIAKSGPNLLCPPETIAVMQALGIDVALLANNHTGDHGGATVLATIHHLEQAGIRTVGAGANLAQAVRPLQLAPKGLRLTLLNFAEHEFGTATADAPGCAPLDPVANIGAIRAAAAEADLVVVVTHGGHERNPMPSPRMIDTFRAFVDAGAHAVINCHTHCPEGIERWKDAPIVYSPGNFFFPWPEATPHLQALWWVGYVPKLHLDRRGVFAVEVLPFHFDNERLHAFPPDDREAFHAYLAELNRLIEDPATTRRLFEAWCARQGPSYLDLLRDRLARWPIPLDSPEAVREFLPVRNLFTCEAHHDMLRQVLRLIEEGRLEAAAAHWPVIERLQQPEWAMKVWRAMTHGAAATNSGSKP